MVQKIQYSLKKSKQVQKKKWFWVGFSLCGILFLNPQMASASKDLKAIQPNTIIQTSLQEQANLNLENVGSAAVSSSKPMVVLSSPALVMGLRLNFSCFIKNRSDDARKTYEL